MASQIPVVVFAYSRPDYLRQLLDSLRVNQVPKIYVFSDAPRTTVVQAAVEEVRQTLRRIDWCEVILCERQQNLGLGKSILAGVTEVFRKEEAVLVFEDDLICVPGSYRYLTCAMDAYKDNPKVFSVTGWTHPRLVPEDIGAMPYFDGKAECWTWGTWVDRWEGMAKTALELMNECSEKGIDIERYGSDLPKMAAEETAKNLWAVRFMYLHIFHGGLCLRPPHSLVEHLGFDLRATTSAGAVEWANPPLKNCPQIPLLWPEVRENIQCSDLWRKTVSP